MPIDAPKKRRARRKREPIDFSKLSPDSLVQMHDIAAFTGYSRGYLYNLRSNLNFIVPTVDTRRAVKFKWAHVLAWVDSLPHPPPNAKAPK